MSISSVFWSAADVFNRYTFIQVFTAVIFMSSNLLNMDLVWVKTIRFQCDEIVTFVVFFHAVKNPGADIGLILYVSAGALTSLYLYCYFGEYTSNTFEKYPQYLYASHWYELPVKFQTYFVLLIGNSQQSLIYDGFKLVSLNLATFLDVSGRFVSLQYSVQVRVQEDASSTNSKTKGDFSFIWH